MRKTILAGVLFVFVLSTALSFAGTVSMAEEDAGLMMNGFHYTISEEKSGKTACIQSYDGPETKVSVPDTLGGVPVTEICFTGTQDRDKITDISLPKTIAAKESLYSSLSILNNLSSITVVDENPELATKDGVLFTKDFSVLGVYPKAKTDTRYTEPDTVKISNGFVANRFLKEITFSSNKEYTATSPCGFSSIEKVVIPPNVTEISESTFEACGNLREIQWGGNETRIGLRAFDNCTGPLRVTLPESVTELSAYSFHACKKLKTVKLPRGLKTIGGHAFAYATALKNITIPDSVLKIDYSAFKHCNVKIKKAPYLKKIAHKYESGEVSYTYVAKAKVTKSGKAKNYTAANITGIKADKKTLRVKKGKTVVLKTIAFISQKKKGALDYAILSYNSSNKKVVKVTKKGIVKGVKKGTAKRVSRRVTAFLFFLIIFVIITVTIEWGG